MQRESSNDATELDYQQYPDMATKRRHSTQELLSKIFERRIGVSKED